MCACVWWVWFGCGALVRFFKSPVLDDKEL